MQQITDFSQSVDDNKIIVNSEKSFLKNSHIVFNGSNNILVVDDGVEIVNSAIKINGDNAVCYIRPQKTPFYADFTVNGGCCVFIGKNTYTNGKLYLIASERQNILIGDDGLFSFGIWIRTADPHLLYDCENKERINPSMSVLIGDHVWVGQNALLLKGTHIGSGSIIGAASVVSHKTVGSNCAAVGNPTKVIKSGVFFTKDCVHNWSEEKTDNSQVNNTDKWTYKKDKTTKDLTKIDEKIKSLHTADEKLAEVKKFFVDNKNKNRFYIAESKHTDTKSTNRIKHTHHLFGL